MPFGKWADLDSCVNSIMKSKGFGKKRASAYCASIERKIIGKKKMAKKAAAGRRKSYSKGAIKKARSKA